MLLKTGELNMLSHDLIEKTGFNAFAGGRNELRCERRTKILIPVAVDTPSEWGGGRMSPLILKGHIAAGQRT
jgi:hypothetical protein